MSNYVYFNENQISTQENDAISLSQVGGMLSFDLLKGAQVFGFHEEEGFRIENDLTASFSGSEIIKIPGVVYNGRFYWRGDWFQNAVPVEVGTNFYYRRQHKAYAYDPVLASFYLQNDLKLSSYMAVDVFVNMKVRNLRAFLKWTHVNQSPNDGYMVTPYFPGQKSVTDLGIQWLFFD